VQASSSLSVSSITRLGSTLNISRGPVFISCTISIGACPGDSVIESISISGRLVSNLISTTGPVLIDGSTRVNGQVVLSSSLSVESTTLLASSFSTASTITGACGLSVSGYQLVGAVATIAGSLIAQGGSLSIANTLHFGSCSIVSYEDCFYVAGSMSITGSNTVDLLIESSCSVSGLVVC
jgi:hypothetical protein